MPDDKLGVAVSAARDVTNDVVSRIADQALRALLARRAAEAPPKWERPEPVDETTRKRMVGKYEGEKGVIRLLERDGELVYEGTPYARVEIRRFGDEYRTDGRLTSGTKVELGQDAVKIGAAEYRRVEDAIPPDPPKAWRELIGEYGWAHNTLFILEREGRLSALIEWVFLYDLSEVEKDVWAFPDFGLYHDERIVFQRDGQGKVTAAVAAGIAFPRRDPGVKDGETFHITPVKPIDELRADAKKATPPPQPPGLLESDLVELVSLEPGLKLDIRYATTNNFMRERFYTQARAFMERPPAEALVRAHQSLAADGYGLLIHDAYRPWSVTKMFWDATPDDMKTFVANPERGSVHNRGAAVDLTMYDLKTGRPMEMPSGYDEFSARAYPDYVGGTSRQRWLRERLRRAMEAQGFTVYPFEWWHFNFRDADRRPVLDIAFEELR
ncbi:MAG: M15 family metallopeptidase [Bryobacterales bacterium]